ncbi:DUF4129 domain-containing protein [Halorubrum lipolyticum]|uniref:Protein-glutamine gamma-glutamyltransferase-like C-terminal domain-containing protein n=1 Tax=Halorubrum lipolyticum DSM 21995 TaxID=1227482 RepID=M0NV13_9EURY|nr:DUF4129 domain-containing protein [Halorubrum lipolyticum]EMA61807.1 hypothetical protein C469_06444 [Halorubrum lipolyticum DSM 21995]
MKRDTLLAVALALLAVVALGVAAATLDSAVSLGGGGFGGAEGDAPSAGDGSGDPGPSPTPGGEASLATQPLCYEFLGEPPALLVLSGVLLAIAAIAYWDTRSPIAALAAAGAVGLPIGLVWWGLATCGSSSTESEFDFGFAGPDEGILPEGAAGGAGAGGGEGAASAPEFLFALVVVVALVASVGVLLLAGGDDEATPGSEAAAEDDPDESARDLAAVGRTAGRAADRIESSDADNEVYRAWRDMTAALDVDRPASSTPAEFANAAVDAGVEEAPVATLTEVFERVRYGGEDATDDRERRAVEALRRIEERHGGDG